MTLDLDALEELCADLIDGTLAAEPRSKQRLLAAIPELIAEVRRLNARVAELEGAMRRIDPWLDGLVCYASTTEEYEPNRLVAQFRAALTAKEAQ